VVFAIETQLAGSILHGTWGKAEIGQLAEVDHIVVRSRELDDPSLPGRLLAAMVEKTRH
jgi:hypothetical protein